MVSFHVKLLRIALVSFKFFTIIYTIIDILNITDYGMTETPPSCPFSSPAIINTGGIMPKCYKSITNVFYNCSCAGNSVNDNTHNDCTDSHSCSSHMVAPSSRS